MGKRVPDDIAVAGYSVFNSAHKQRADIPTVIHDPYAVGVTAGDLVLRRLRKGKASVTRKEYLIKPTTNFPTS
jgi:DNA-binding LacI/PurR family transcriptional regulator